MPSWSDHALIHLTCPSSVFRTPTLGRSALTASSTTLSRVAYFFLLSKLYTCASRWRMAPSIRAHPAVLVAM